MGSFVNNWYGNAEVAKRILGFDGSPHNTLFIGDSVTTNYAAMVVHVLPEECPMVGMILYPDTSFGYTLGGSTLIGMTQGGVPAGVTFAAYGYTDGTTMSGFLKLHKNWREFRFEVGQTISDTSDVWYAGSSLVYGYASDQSISCGPFIRQAIAAGKKLKGRLYFYAHPNAPTGLRMHAIVPGGTYPTMFVSKTTFDMYDAVAQIKYYEFDFPVNTPDFAMSSIRFDLHASASSRVGAGEVGCILGGEIFVEGTGIKFANWSTSGSVLPNFTMSGSHGYGGFWSSPAQFQAQVVSQGIDSVIIMLGVNGQGIFTHDEEQTEMETLIASLRTAGVQNIAISTYIRISELADYYAPGSGVFRSRFFTGYDTGWSYTAATKTWTKTNGLVSYVWRLGDVVWLKAGTGATLGYYRITSKTNNDSFVTATGPAAGNLTSLTIGVGRLFNATSQALIDGMYARWRTIIDNTPNTLFLDIQSKTGNSASWHAINVGDTIHESSLATPSEGGLNAGQVNYAQAVMSVLWEAAATAASAADVANAVWSLSGRSLDGDVAGKVLGSGTSTIIAAGVRADDRDGEAIAKASAVTTVLDRLGAWTGSARNTLLGAIQSLFRKDTDAAVPSDINADLGGGAGAANNTTDSAEAIRDAMHTASQQATDKADILAALAASATPANVSIENESVSIGS